MTSVLAGKSKAWWFNREVNLVVLVQLMLLGSLIVGSWFNLQNQLEILQHDVARLLESQESFEVKIEQLSSKSISHECRLQLVEKAIDQGNGE